jgi:hypothetical protein
MVTGPANYQEGITMRNRFTRGLCLVAASAAITTSFGLAAAGAASAGTKPHATKNATTVCGGLCTDISNAELDNTGTAAFIMNAVGGVSGHAINMRRAGNAKVNEDFTAGFVGFLGQFCENDGGHGLDATSYVCVNYPPFWDVFEANFAPDSNESGKCVGLGRAGVSQPVRLVPCGATTRTLFVGDLANGLGGDCRVPGNYCPWVAASDTFVTHPLALTVNLSSHNPANRLSVTRENLSGGVVSDPQQFTTNPGPAF